MPPQTATRSRSLPPTLRGGTTRAAEGRRPTDLNKPGFLDRFVSDIGTLFTNAPRALLNIAGAPISDLYALAPGGREAGTVGRATAGVVGDLGKSLWDTGQRIDALGNGGGVVTAPSNLLLGLVGGEGLTERLGGERFQEAVEAYRQNPGLLAVEDIGNVALVGAGAAQGLGAGARAAAGQRGVGRAAAQGAREAVASAGRGRVGQAVAGRAARRAANRAALEDIAASGGKGSRLAQGSLFSDDLIAHPYRAAGRGLRDTKIPGAGASAGEVLEQVRSATPLDRMTVTPEMKDAATLRSMRARVEDLSRRAWEAQKTGDPGAEALWDDWTTETQRLTQFEEGLGGRLEQVEQTRLAPTPVDDLESPLARDIRRVLDTESVQRLTEPFVRMRRQTKGMVQDLRKTRGDESLEILAQRDPAARRRMALRNLRDLGDDLEQYGIEAPGILERMDDGQLLDTLVRVAENPELRGMLPNLEPTLDLTILDLAEATQGLPEGSLRNQLYDDATLTPRVANIVRALQREGAGSGSDTVRLYRAMPEEFDLARIGDDGVRFTEDLDYALSHVPEGQSPYLYELEVPADRLNVGTSEFAQIQGGIRGVRDITPDEVANARLVDPDAARSRIPDGVREQLPDDVRGVVEEALGQAYRIPDEQLANRIADQPAHVQAAYERALRRLTEEAADRDVQLADLGLGDPDRWAMRVVNEDGRYRAMTPDESPSLAASPSKRQARKLRRLGVQVGRARRRLEDAVDAAARRGDEGKAGAYDRYRTAVRDQQRAARAWDKARRAGDEELAASLRKELDTARGRARKARVDARKDVFSASQAAARALESVVRSMQDSTVPVGGAVEIASQIEGIRNTLDTLFAEADVAPSARLTSALQRLDEAGIDVAAADANTLDNLNLMGAVDRQVDSQWRDAVSDSRDAVRGSKAARLNVRNVENLLRSEERARVAAAQVRRLERRLDNAEGRLGDIDLDELDKARIRQADANQQVIDVAEELGLSSEGGQRVLGDRLLREQVKARMRQTELRRVERAFDRVQNAFDQAESEMLTSVEAAPAVARPVLQVSRALGDVDEALRSAGLDQLADDLALRDLPQTLDDMEAAGVSPTFLRRMEERAAAVGYRAAAEKPVGTPTMRAQRRREMADIEVRRDIDRVKAETDIELAARVLNGQMVEGFLDRFGRTPDQIAESLIEAGILNRDAWRDMTKGQRERLLQEQGFNAYVPDQIFSFKVRRTGPGDAWIPTHLNDALTEYVKQGPVERILTQAVGPVTTTWKHFILALRPAWHVYNVVGNAMLATAGGGANVASYLDFMRPGGEAREMMRRHRLGWDLEDFGLNPSQADDLLGGGVSRDLAPEQRTRARLSDAMREPESIKRAMDSRVARRAAGPLSKARRGLDTAVSASYRANAYMDHLNRASLYLYETVHKGTDVETALQRVNKVLGDYENMTPTERVYVRSVFPFYAWMRHITGLTVDMLKPDNITRTAILGTVVNTLGTPEGEEALLPEYMAGDIQIGNTGAYLGMRGFNPWQDVLDVGLYNGEVSTRGALRSMHPAIQFVQERNTGIDTLTGRPFSRPVPVLDDLGREIPTAPPLGEHLFQSFAPPQAQLLRRIGRSATGQTNARYSTGDPVLLEGVSEPSALAGLGSFIGAPVRVPELEGVEERRQAAMDRASRQIARYQEEVEAYRKERSRRSLGERLIPFGD